MNSILVESLPQTKILPKELEDFLNNLKVKFHHHIKYSPTIDFNKRKGELVINGESISMFSRSLFGEVSERVEDYFDLSDHLFCQLNFSNVNTLTIRGLLSMFIKLNEYHQVGKQVKLEWKINEGDEDMRTIAEDLKTCCKFPFEIKS